MFLRTAPITLSNSRVLLTVHFFVCSLQDTTGVVEKGDLVSRVREAAAKGPEGGTAASAPAGYAYDPSSGYWYSSESIMYWDPTTGGFCSNGKWYAYDAASGQFVEWATG